MTALWQVKVFDNKQLVFTAEVDGPVELGRQGEKEVRDQAGTSKGKPIYEARQDAGVWRIVVARIDESVVSRRHVRAEPQPGGQARLHNLGKAAVQFADGSELKPGAVCDLALPVLLSIGNRTVRLQEVEAPGTGAVHLESLVEATRAPGQNEAAFVYGTLQPTGDARETLIPWLRAAMSVLHSAAGSSDFFDKAARAVVDLVSMDAARILLRDAHGWKMQTVQTRRRLRPDEDRPLSRGVLDKLLEQKRTFWEAPMATDAAHSLAGVQAVVAAPILDRAGEVIGALYGDRRQDGGGGSAQPISRLEAMLVELLAGGVAAGLARLEYEQAALRARVQFEQFFTPELTRQLAADPDMLKGRDAEVSVLFCDIRGFSRISGQLGPARTVEWIGSVMEELSTSVLAHQGVLVDYIGDELMAMWGAPEAEPAHALLACRAAVDMLELLPALNERWKETLGGPMGFGIGINTGMARCGQTGSTRKFKYGPLGHAVNLASRVQGASKYLKSKLLITEATKQRLDGSLPARRICQVRVVNIPDPVTLYELASSSQPDWPQRQAEYEQALNEFERGHFPAATTILGRLLAAHPHDGPALVLLSRAVNAQVTEPNPFDPVWELPGK